MSKTVTNTDLAIIHRNDVTRIMDINRIIEKHAEALACDLRKAKKERKWRGDGKGNLIENMAVDEAIRWYAFINGEAILAEAGLLAHRFEWNNAEIKELYNGIKALALLKANARLWTA